MAKTPPRVRKTNIFVVFYLLVLHSVTCLKTCHFAACFTIPWTSISFFYVKTALDVVTVLLIFAISLYLHIFTCTYKGTHTQAHMYNQHTRGMATTRHRSLVERGGRKALLETMHIQKHKNLKKNRYSRIWRKNSSTQSFQQSYKTISYEVIKATSIRQGWKRKKDRKRET